MIHVHYSQFRDVAELVEKKRRCGGKVSLVVPAYNESSTIGRLITEISGTFVERYQLLDEIVVINGPSTDDTDNMARRAGATVYQAKDILPNESIPNGKGTSLWKSLFVTTGDIILCLDADIENFDPGFICGLVGPMLTYDSVEFVKAHYLRPFTFGDNRLPDYGGRVTEILVRPLLSLFLPECASIIQPLSGEYAFRASCIESIPFSSGYGVDIGLVIDIFRLTGFRTTAQVDLGTRIHRNRPVRELSSMSFAILHTLSRKFQDAGIWTLRQPLHRELVRVSGSERSLQHIPDMELPSKSTYLSSGISGESR